MESFLSCLLVAYYVLSYSQSIPCIVKLLKTKKSGDYSLLNRLLQYSALMCWTIYLTITKVPSFETDWYLIAIGWVDVFLLTFENALILKYYHKK